MTDDGNKKSKAATKSRKAGKAHAHEIKKANAISNPAPGGPKNRQTRYNKAQTKVKEASDKVAIAHREKLEAIMPAASKPSSPRIKV